MKLGGLMIAGALWLACTRDQVPPGGPLASFRGVESDLAGICIGPK
jgi:hypothetical protein